MANLTMTYDEVKLAQRILGIRRYSFKATKNSWRRRVIADRPTIISLQEKGHVQYRTGSEDWFLTPQGIQQLKLQMGEFSFR